MFNSQKKSVLSLFLALTLVLSLFVGILPTSASAAVTQGQIDALREKRNEISSKKAEQQAIVDELEMQQADVLAQKQALDERNAYTIEQMQLNAEEIALYDDMIEEKAQEVEEAKKLEAEQLERYRVRIRAMEERGSYNILALILKSTNLGELLTTIDDVGEIMESDRALEDAYIAAREHTEEVKAEYEQVKVELEAKQAELEAEQQRLEQELQEATDLIERITADIIENAAIIAQLQAEQDAADAKINEMVAALEEQRRQEALAAQQQAQQQAQQNAQQGGGNTSSGGSVVGTGNFAWPVACTYITSCVGYRYHPITGAWKYHAGMDIGSSYGSTIWASDSGTVILSGWNGGYGECVMIDHGNGYYTLYGHMSSRAVSEGQAVSQGQTIGYVGSTGNSTGPHLHFEIRNSDGPIDFNGWFSGLTYAPDSGG